MKKKFILLIIIILILIIFGFYYIYNYPVFGCTKEARACPNGMGVGRVGFKCEFAPCELPSSLEECKQKEGFWRDWCYRDYAVKVVSDANICNLIKRNYVENECFYLINND